MHGYSINGYLNAVLRRSEKTLLLEGITDKSLIKRLQLNHTSAISGTPKGNIDCVGIISDTSLATLGHKVRIVEICRAASALTPPNREKVMAKLGTLTDREWDGIDIAAGLPCNWNPPTQSASSFTTLGHSIENYFFNAAGVIAYLKQSFPDDVSIEFLKDLQDRFHQMVALATSYSLRLHDQQAITRASGAISYKFVAWGNDRYTVIDALDNVLHARGQTLPPDFYTLINADVDIYLNHYDSVEPGRWLCHGHLGEQAIWSCIGSLAKEHGFSDEIAIAIERGSQNIRQKHAADHLCTLANQERQPLDEAITWLTS